MRLITRMVLIIGVRITLVACTRQQPLPQSPTSSDHTKATPASEEAPVQIANPRQGRKINPTTVLHPDKISASKTDSVLTAPPVSTRQPSDHARMRNHVSGGLSLNSQRTWEGPQVPPFVALTEKTQELFLLDLVPDGYLAFYRDPYGASSCTLGDSNNCTYHIRLYKSDGQIQWSHSLTPFFSRKAHLEIQDIRYDQGVLYFNEACQSYSSRAKGNCSSLVALNPLSGEELWRSPTLTSNNVFMLFDRYILSGYGFTDEPDYLFLIDRKTGLVKDRLKIPAAHSWFEETAPGHIEVSYYYQKKMQIRLKGLDTDKPTLIKQRITR